MKILIYITVVFFGFNLNAKPLSYDEIVEKYIPLEMVNAIDTDSNPPKKVERQEIGRKFFVYDYGSKDGSKILLATYDTKSLSVENPTSKTLAIKVMKDGKTSLIKAPDGKDDYAITERSDITLSDINGDGINEIVVTDSDDKEKFWESLILKWNGKTFEEIKFQLTERESDLLPQLQRGALPLLVYEDVLKNQEKGLHKIKQMKPDGSFVDLGTFNFIKILSKDSKKIAEREYDIEDVSEGQYTLEVKNLSKHPRSVRAEISINDIVVLKPTDFCHGRPKIFVKEKDKKGNPISEDDDDDENEDKCKRCDPRKDIYAAVNLKSKDNVLKAKLYGNKNSKIQITLKKKN
jgi:hypothetical protein